MKPLIVFGKTAFILYHAPGKKLGVPYIKKRELTLSSVTALVLARSFMARKPNDKGLVGYAVALYCR